MKDIPYSKDFSGVEKIKIESLDYSKKSRDPKNKNVSDKEVLKKIKQLLNSFPKKGEVFISAIPSNVITLIAIKEETPFARIEIFNNKIRAEDTAFFKNDTEALEQEFNLLKLIQQIMEK